jgi:hypothetical protein
VKDGAVSLVFSCIGIDIFLLDSNIKLINLLIQNSNTKGTKKGGKNKNTQNKVMFSQYTVCTS